MTYKVRIVDQVLDQLMPQLPAILLDGAKAVGKTTTAKQRARTVKDFAKPAERAFAEANLAAIGQGQKPILLDEWQRVPSVWDGIKVSVDQDFSGGQYLLTGSLPDFSTHSGAGRITALRMRPLSFAERDLIAPSVSLAKLLDGKAEVAGRSELTFFDYAQEMSKSGFPALRALSGRPLQVALDGYIERLLDTDLKELGLTSRRPAQLRGWLTSYAAATATTASWEAIRDGATGGFSSTPAKTTIAPYRDALTRLRIMDELAPWLPTQNRLKRASQASKHFLVDPALAMRLLNLDLNRIKASMFEKAFIKDAPLFGRLFEALVVQSIQTYAEANFAKTMHYRDFNGRHEVDLIVEGDDGRVLAIEVKYSVTPKQSDLVHLKWLKRELGEEIVDCVVIYAGEYAFRKEGVAYIPLALLGV